MARAISDDFLKALKDGEFSPIVEIVRKDVSLSLHFRGTYVTIYYKSCRILEINPMKENPFEIAEGYDCPVKPDKNTNWQDYFMRAKFAIDIHPKSSGLEKDIQQRIVHENNFSRVSNGTDYFIIDIEYTESDFREGRFDMIAAFWPKNNRANGNNVKLALIEVKVGETAIDGSSGIIKHLEDAKQYLSSDKIAEFVPDMEKVFTQLRKLELVRFGQTGNPHQVFFSKTDFQFIFVIADYNQNSTQLRTALADVTDNNLPFKLLFATASFMGYGLYVILE
jgi:hypothetical protein